MICEQDEIIILMTPQHLFADLTLLVACSLFLVPYFAISSSFLPSFPLPLQPQICFGRFSLDHNDRGNPLGKTNLKT